MAIIKYRTERLLNRIVAVEIIRETKNFVFFTNPVGKDLKRPKKSDDPIFHDSWEDAHRHLIERTEYRIKQAKKKVEMEEKDLQTILSMKPI